MARASRTSSVVGTATRRGPRARSAATPCAGGDVPSPAASQGLDGVARRVGHPPGVHHGIEPPGVDERAREGVGVGQDRDLAGRRGHVGHHGRHRQPQRGVADDRLELVTDLGADGVDQVLRDGDRDFGGTGKDGGEHVGAGVAEVVEVDVQRRPQLGAGADRLHARPSAPPTGALLLQRGSPATADRNRSRRRASPARRDGHGRRHRGRGGRRCPRLVAGRCRPARAGRRRAGALADGCRPPSGWEAPSRARSPAETEARKPVGSSTTAVGVAVSVLLPVRVRAADPGAVVGQGDARDGSVGRQGAADAGPVRPCRDGRGAAHPPAGCRRRRGRGASPRWPT